MRAKKYLFCLLFCLTVIFNAAAQESSAGKGGFSNAEKSFAEKTSGSDSGISSVDDSRYLVQGFDAFQKNDWATALFFLRKAATLPDSAGPEVWYMLVMSEMFAGEYEAAVKDGELFASFYPDSPYRPYVEYQVGRALHYIGEYDLSIRRLGLFCSQNPHHEFYASALFWMGESLYAAYYFNLAKPLYERIISEFPDSAKYTESLYRLDLILQREREEKLLYLLKVTGEEYLSSKEEYERQLKQYQTEESLGLRKQLKEAQSELQTYKVRLEEAQKMRDQQTARASGLQSQNDVLIKQNDDLKIENTRMQSLIDQLRQAVAASQSQAEAASKTAEAAASAEALLRETLKAEEQLKSAAEQRAAAEKRAADEKKAEDQNKTQPLPFVAPSESDEEMKDEIRKLKTKALEIQRALDQPKSPKGAN